MENKKLQEVATKINEMFEEHEREKTEAAGKIRTARQMQREANEAGSEPFSKLDIAGYHRAQDAAREAKDTAEMYQKHVERLEKAPLLREEEYNNLAQEIMDELAYVVSKDKEKIISLIDKMRVIADQESEIIEEGNRLLHILQHKCYKDDACLVTAKGAKIPPPTWPASTLPARIAKISECYTIIVQLFLPGNTLVGGEIWRKGVLYASYAERNLRLMRLIRNIVVLSVEIRGLVSGVRNGSARVAI